MKIAFGDAVSIASLYLGLVGLLSTFFSIHLGEWLNRVQGTESKWIQVRSRQPRDNFFSQRLECYYEAASATAPGTWLGWIAVTAFLAMILGFAEYLRAQLDAEDSASLFRFVHVPCYLFFATYLAVSLYMLVTGYRKAKTVRDTAVGEL